MCLSLCLSLSLSLPPSLSHIHPSLPDYLSLSFVILALGILRQEDGEIEAILDFIVRPCLKT
jgi:hypothetical protein